MRTALVLLGILLAAAGTSASERAMASKLPRTIFDPTTCVSLFLMAASPLAVCEALAAAKRAAPTTVILSSTADFNTAIKAEADYWKPPPRG